MMTLSTVLFIYTERGPRFSAYPRLSRILPRFRDPDFSVLGFNRTRPSRPPRVIEDVHTYGELPTKL
jgi:hypothetical protein